MFVKACRKHGEKRTAYRSLVGKPGPLGRPRRSCENDIKVDVREIKLGGVDWFHLAWNGDQWRALVNTPTNIRIPCNVGNFLNTSVTSWFDR